MSLNLKANLMLMLIMTIMMMMMTAKLDECWWCMAICEQSHQENKGPKWTEIDEWMIFNCPFWAVATPSGTTKQCSSVLKVSALSSRIRTSELILMIILIIINLEPMYKTGSRSEWFKLDFLIHNRRSKTHRISLWVRWSPILRHLANHDLWTLDCHFCCLWWCRYPPHLEASHVVSYSTPGTRLKLHLPVITHECCRGEKEARPDFFSTSSYILFGLDNEQKHCLGLFNIIIECGGKERGCP